MYIHTYIHPTIHLVLNQPLPSHPQNAVATVASDGGVRGNIFGSNLGRLQQIKAKYDPNNAPGQQGPSKHNSFFFHQLWCQMRAKDQNS